MKHFYRVAHTGLAVLLFAFAQIAEAQQYPRIKDDPKGRAEFERRMLIDPVTGEIPDNIRENELNFVLSSPTLNSGQDKAATWTNRGPYNVGGRTRALALDKANESIILAGGVSGGMWRSTNGGTSWIKTTGASDLQSVTCIAQDPRSGSTNVWYYGTGEGYGNSASGGGAAYRGNGIYKSTDNGLTWVQLPSTSANPTVFSGGFQYNWNIVVNPTNGNVYAATAGGIYRSQDGGTNWTNVLDAGTSSVKYTDIQITTTGVMYATISSAGSPNKGIFRSTDGTTWTSIYSALPTSYDRICIGIAPSNQNVVYFFANTVGTGTNDHSFYKYTYVSGNGSGSGGTWVVRSTNLPAYGGSVGNLSQGSYNQFVSVKPDNENFVVIGSTNIYRSTDAFATNTNNRWIGGYSPANNVSRYPNHHPDNHSFIFLPSNPLTALSGHDGGISRTTDISRNNTGNEPVAWTQLNNGYLTTQAYAVAIDQNTSGDNRIMAGFQDNGKWYINSSSGTAAWGEEVAGGDGAFVAIVPGTTTNTRYHSTQNGNVMRSVGNDPANPTDVDGIQPSSATGQLFINPYILDPNNSNIMYYAGGTRVWRNGSLSTINSGYTFSGTTTGWTNMTGTAVSTGTVSALAVSKATNANVLYYGTTDGQVYRVDNANSGTGTRVDIYTSKGFPAGAYVSAIAVDPANSANVMVCFSNYAVKSIFYSTNSGSTWADISGNLEQNPDGSGNGPSVRWVHVHLTSTNAKVYLVGTSTGLYATETLNGTSTVWTQEGATSIGNAVVSMLMSRQSDNLVAIATHANGLFSGTVTASGGGVCNVPTGLASSSITSSSAAVSWGAVSGANSYDVRYRVNGTGTWLDVLGLTTTTTNITGLTASTAYEFQVRTNCSGGTSSYSSSATFTTSAAATCAVPSGLGSGSITSSGATVSWTAVSGAVSYDLQYRVNGTSTWTSITGITATSRALSGLTASTTYEFQVRTNCSGSSSAFSSSATFTTLSGGITYCASKGNSVADEYINRVQYGSINNTSGANAGYADFTAQSTSIARGASTTITITPAWTGSTYAEGFSVWIDYNQNGVFTDTGEQVYTRAASTATPATGSFTIPATATLGNTRMRVSMKYNAIPTSCETFSYGEVEDYTVNITAAAACAVPSGLSSSSITASGATVSWAAVSGAVSYDLQYRVNGTSTWTSVAGITTTARALTGLTAATTYEYQVRTNCSGSSSAYSASATFTTATATVSYCASKGNSVADEYINRVQLGSINNTSGANAGYGNFTAQSTTLVRSTSNTITITPAWTGTVYSEGYRVWIDYNQDGDFADTGEQVYSRTATTATPISGSFTVPATATLGNTRMRVSMKYNGVPTSCETFSYGEVEDYTVNITATSQLNPNGEEIASETKFGILNLYPNPADKGASTTVKFYIPEKTDVSIALTNVHGIGVSSERLLQVQGKLEHTFRTTQLQSGVYFVNVITADGQRVVQKLVVR